MSIFLVLNAACFAVVFLSRLRNLELKKSVFSDTSRIGPTFVDTVPFSSEVRLKRAGSRGMR